MKINIKKIGISILLSVLAFYLCAQSQYESGMKKAFDLIKEQKIEESVALFERISQAENDKWLPAYHAAHTLIWNSFGTDEIKQKEEMLERAKVIIAQAHKRSEDNAEIFSLEAMLYTSYMAYDPAKYGMMYAAKIEGLHNKAFELAPTNPRVLSGKIQYARGKASFFGQDLSPYCEEMKKIITTFQEEETDESFAPKHGLEQAKMFLLSCNE